MTLREFHNALRILTSIDMHELVDADVIEPGDMSAWAAFSQDPYRWFIRADDDTAEQLWRLIERRQPKTHPNSAPMFAADGTMLDEQGNRSIFDDVDE